MKFLASTILCLSLVHAIWAEAEQCTSEKCKIIDNCRCSSTRSPLTQGEPPQLIALTFDEAVVSNFYDDYWEPLLRGRRNPDGNSISATFYVPHEYTDYEKVQKLYLSGYEIGVNSISKNGSQEYWRSASLETLVQEFGGQRQVISHFANIPVQDIRGARTPQFQLEGDVSITAYIQSGIIYDNSWPTYSNNLLYPYTLDYASTQRCTGGNRCPVESHPGFWIAPITNIKGKDGIECNSLINCYVEGTAAEISNWLLGEVERVRSSTKTPISILVNDAWFQFTNNSYDGFVLFLDTLAQKNDVFLVSQAEVIEWVQDPVPLANFRTATHNRNANCSPVNCELENIYGNLRYMMSCVPCPDYYPWVGNPLGDNSGPVTPVPPTRLPTRPPTQPPTEPPIETTTEPVED